MEYETIIVREKEKLVILKENILLYNDDIIIFYETYLLLRDVIDDLAIVMTEFDLSYENVKYDADINKYEHFRHYIMSDGINCITYTKGIMRLTCGEINCRYLNLVDVPTLLFVLRIINRMLKFVD